VYWFPASEPAQVETLLKPGGLEVTEIKKAVCLPLSRRVEVGLVSPAAWETYDLCRRQFSWYRQSPRAGQTLVVSSRLLPDIAPAPDVIIRNGSFRPPRLPTPEEQQALMARASYREARPEEWEKIGAVDREEQTRWLKVMGLQGTTFEELFVGHCANHANFIEPVYRVLEEGRPVPYSLGKTRTVCSACLEFYNIIGSSFQKKYVVPCPGAVLFAGMVPNHYYEVVCPGGGKG
jgi:hypothetical protein